MSKNDDSRKHPTNLEHSHTPSDIAERLQANTRHSYLKDFVYGGTDGVVTTFAVVSGVAGASLGTDVIILLGAANLVADGFSMAASNYLGTRTEEQMRNRTRAMEVNHIEVEPEGEKEEVRQIFAAKGFEGDDLEKAVEIITNNKKLWVDTMLVDEHGLSLEGPSPIKAALTTFWAFVVIGLLPLLPFLIFAFSNGIRETSSSWLYVWSTGMTATAFFLVGASKSVFVGHSWIKSGLETLAIGGLAAALAYLIGFGLHALVGAAV